MKGSLMTTLLQIYRQVSWWMNLENQSVFGEITAKSKKSIRAQNVHLYHKHKLADVCAIHLQFRE